MSTAVAIPAVSMVGLLLNTSVKSLLSAPFKSIHKAAIASSTVCVSTLYRVSLARKSTEPFTSSSGDRLISSSLNATASTQAFISHVDFLLNSQPVLRVSVLQEKSNATDNCIASSVIDCSDT